MKLERLHIIVFLGVAVLAWWLVLLAQGSHLVWEHLRPFGAVVGILVILGLGFELVLWHHPWLHGWFVKRPDLRGTWCVTLESGLGGSEDASESAANSLLHGGRAEPVSHSDAFDD